MSSWGSTHFTGRVSANPLIQAVADMPPRLKQAIYGKMQLGDFKQRTWNDCVINRAADHQVFSTRQAAKHFNVEERVISNFIIKWDHMAGFTLRESNDLLRDTLLEVGLFSEAGEYTPDREVRSVLERVYTSEETRMKEAFEALVGTLETASVHDASETQVELIGDIKQADDLFACNHVLVNS